MKKTLSLVALAFGFLFALAPVAQAQTWTAVASTGTVDESAEAFYGFGANPTSLGYLGGSASVLPVVARYNVTDISGTEKPAWNTLELGYLENSANAAVTATFYQVDPCSGQRTPICTVTSVNSAIPNCVRCTFDTTIDFANFLYYVEVTVTRANANLFPTANTLRIY
jgi:hypothetical protein